MPMQLDSWRLGNPLLEATGNKSESSVSGLRLWGSSNRNRGWLQGPAIVGVQASSIFLPPPGPGSSSRKCSQSRKVGRSEEANHSQAQ